MSDGQPRSARFTATTLVMGLMLCNALQTTCDAQEFVPFRLTGYEGYLSASYLTDNSTTRLPESGGTPSFTETLKQADLRTELFLMTHSYVYHPKFLTLAIGGGPVFVSGRVETDGVAYRSQEPLFNLTARATMLADKPFRGTVFFEHYNPAPSLSTGETFKQQNEKYGVSWSLLAPLTPVPLTFDATRDYTKGSSTERVMNDRVDQISLRANRALGTFGTTTLAYDARQQLSASGARNLPIQNSRQDLQSLVADTRALLNVGKTSVDLYNSISYTAQKYTLAQGDTLKYDDFGFLLNYRGAHSSDLRTYANFQFSDNHQDTRATIGNVASAGVSWAPSKDVGMSAGVHENDVRSTQFSIRNWGSDGWVSYNRALPLGTGQVSYSLRYTRRDQTASTSEATIVGERLTLAVTTPVALSQPRVMSSTVVVLNLARTQTFIDGIDYLLTVVGTTTRIQRMLAGSILDREVVLLDYSFDAGGTYISTQLDQSFSLNWAASRYLNIYFRYADAAPRLISGTPSSPLNAIRSTLYGTRADIPLQLSFNLSVGGFIEREDHRATIAPYTRTASEAYIQGEIPLLFRTNFRLATRRNQVDADNVLQTSKLVGYDLMLSQYFDFGLLLTASRLNERDSGFEFRTRKTAVLKALWRYRRLTLSADFAFTRESQGSYSRDRTAGSANLRRDF